MASMLLLLLAALLPQHTTSDVLSTTDGFVTYPPCFASTSGRQVAEMENAATYRQGHKAMANRLVIITGGDSGIGLSTATALARANATLIIASYDPTGSGAAAKQKIERFVPNSKIEVMRLDLSKLSSVRTLASQILGKGGDIDVLINCAGIAEIPTGLSQVTADGFDRVFQTNYLGHFLLTELLLPKMRLNPSGARVINVASEASFSACPWANAASDCLVPATLQLSARKAIGNPLTNNSFGVRATAYGITKLLQVYHAQELSRRENLLARNGVAGTCAESLTTNCATSRSVPGHCAICAGQKQHALMKAGCAHAQISDYCAGGPGAGVTAFSLHPGVVATPMLHGWDDAVKLWCSDPTQGTPCPRSADEGSATVVYAAVAQTLPVVQDGCFFDLCVPKDPAAWPGVADGQVSTPQSPPRLNFQGDV